MGVLSVLLLVLLFPVGGLAEPLVLLFPVLVAVGLPVAVGELGDSLLSVLVPGESGDKGNEGEYYGHNIILVFGVSWIDIA